MWLRDRGWCRRGEKREGVRVAGYEGRVGVGVVIVDVSASRGSIT